MCNSISPENHLQLVEKSNKAITQCHSCQEYSHLARKGKGWHLICGIFMEKYNWTNDCPSSKIPESHTYLNCVLKYKTNHPLVAPSSLPETALIPNPFQLVILSDAPSPHFQQAKVPLSACLPPNLPFFLCPLCFSGLIPPIWFSWLFSSLYHLFPLRGLSFPTPWLRYVSACTKVGF